MMADPTTSDGQPDPQIDDTAEDSAAEDSATEEEVRTGVYVCYCGGNIGDVVDVERVARESKELPGVVVSRTQTFMCSDSGQAAIEEDVKEFGLNRVVVASCTPKLHEGTFRGVLERAGVNVYLLEQANIREQVSWVHHDTEQATTKAISLVEAAVSKASSLEPLEPVRVEAKRRALVLGGGVAGMRAALDLADTGLEVFLVEREKQLGGFVRRLDRLYPNEEAAPELVERLREAVARAPLIEVMLGTEIVRAGGYVGNFTAVVRSDGGVAEEAEAAGENLPETTLEIGALIVATGFRPYEPPQGELGYGQQDNVITLPEFVEWQAGQREGQHELEYQGRPVRSVGFVHCVGSRQVEGVHEPQPDGEINRYCSRVCCTSTLHAECRLREICPDVEIHDFYQDIRTYGLGQEDYYDKASTSDVVFYRYDGSEPPSVQKAPSDDPRSLLVTLKDGLTWGEEVEVGVDLLVLAVGMMPADNKSLVTTLKLPVSADRFLQEVHPKLQPVEQAVTGVFLAGTCQAPKDVGESAASASAAASKAAAIIERGMVELDPYVAAIDERLCNGSGLCVDECSYDGAIRLLDLPGGRRRAEINPAVCVGCGCCVAVCPTRAIDINGWTLGQFEAMVDAFLATDGSPTVVGA
jgi:heterodisulfide reductase subunit A